MKKTLSFFLIALMFCVVISVGCGGSSDATINGRNLAAGAWAGINCLGDATIILEGNNSVKGFQQNYPGIHVPAGKTLTIKGDGELTASSSGQGAGIGGGYELNCGNIVVEGGTITATGGAIASGIGSGWNGSCSSITINTPSTKLQLRRAGLLRTASARRPAAQ